MAVLPLSIEEGIKIQSTHLKQWETVLKPEVYQALEAWATKYNDKAKNGYQITRGSELSSFVQNFMYGHKDPIQNAQFN